MNRQFTTALTSIDVHFIRRHNRLRPGASGRIVWRRNGRDESQISFTRTDHAIQLRYALPPAGYGQSTKVHETIALATTNLHRGGTCVWFVCPQCKKHVAILYLTHHVACRRCMGLVYKSQYEYMSASERELRKLVGM